MRKDERQRPIIENDNFCFFCIFVRCLGTHFIIFHYNSFLAKEKTHGSRHLCRAISGSILSPLLNSIGQLSQNTLGIIPTDTSISDGNAVFEARFSFLGHLLVAFADVGFDHYAHDCFFSSGDLGGEFVGDFGLVHVVFFGIAVAVCVEG
jgi:hypothetical protein